MLLVMYLQVKSKVIWLMLLLEQEVVVEVLEVVVVGHQVVELLLVEVVEEEVVVVEHYPVAHLIGIAPTGKNVQVMEFKLEHVLITTTAIQPHKQSKIAHTLRVLMES